MHILLICFVLLSCCSIFKDHVLPFFRQLDYYTTFFLTCQYLFQNFFKFFQVFFKRVDRGLSPSSGDLHIIPHTGIVCQALFSHFFYIWRLPPQRTNRTDPNCIFCTIKTQNHTVKQRGKRCDTRRLGASKDKGKEKSEE